MARPENPNPTPTAPASSRGAANARVPSGRVEGATAGGTAAAAASSAPTGSVTPASVVSCVCIMTVAAPQARSHTVSAVAVQGVTVVSPAPQMVHGAQSPVVCVKYEPARQRGLQVAVRAFQHRCVKALHGTGRVLPPLVPVSSRTCHAMAAPPPRALNDTFSATNTVPSIATVTAASGKVVVKLRGPSPWPK